jgi:TolB-like protein
MNLHLATTLLCLATCGLCFAQEQGMENAVSDLSIKLATQVVKQGKKKVTVLDFTDLQGNSSELGRYLAEQITVNLVLEQTNYSVLDRANLKSILAEHKLTSTGLVAPENAKKLGQFAGVDALILGTIVQINQGTELTAKIIATDSAVIAGAARVKFKADPIVQHLLSKPASEFKNADAEKSKVSRTFGDLRAEVRSLKIVNGKDFLLTLLLTNQNPKRSIWVAVNTDLQSNVRGSLIDTKGTEFQTDHRLIMGVQNSAHQHGGFFEATEIKPANATTATIKFFSRKGGFAEAGSVRLQLELLLGNSYERGFGEASIQNLTCNIEAD